MRADRSLVEVLCVYELAALHSGGRLPTVTAVCWAYRRSGWCWAAVGAALGWLGWHLLEQR